MKKIITLLNSLGVVALIPTPLLLSTTSCGSIHSTIKHCNVYQVNVGDDQSYSYQQIPNVDIPIHLFNNSQVPYMEVDLYVDWLMKFEDAGGHDYLSQTNSNKTTITNEFNQETCVIDYKQQTISFHDYDNFENYDINYNNPFATGIIGGEQYFKYVENDYFTPSTPYVINLQKYNIVAYNDGKEGYLPLDLLHNIINPSRSNAPYFFNGEALYEYVDPGKNGGDKVVDLYSLPKSKATILTSEYMEFTYNLLALTLDHRFGLISRPSRLNPGTTLTYLPNGAYAALKPYHNKIVSLKPDESNQGIKDFFDNELDDGGHALYKGVNLLSSKGLEWHKGPENAYTGTVITMMHNERAKTDFYFDDPMGSGGADERIELIDIDSDGSKDTAWVTFDSFWKPTWELKYENVSNDTSGDHTPYQYDTISMTMYLQKIVNKKITGDTIKNVVIDLTNNTGGIVWCEHFIASYLCGSHNKCVPQHQSITGGVTHTLYNPHTNAMGKYTVYADVNQDGKYDQDDYLPDNVNLYCITAPSSFSCGNMLPYDLATCGNCRFIGETSGGGACFVDSEVRIGLGSIFTGSSNFHLLDNKSTIGNYISMEGGNKVPDTDCPLPLDAPAAFFNRDQILNWIKQQ